MNKVTTIIHKVQLSKEEIDRQVDEATQYKATDEREWRRMAAKNALESYCFKIMSTVEEGELKGTISRSDKTSILDKCNEVLRWLSSNPHAKKEQFELQKKKLELVCNRINIKL
jgi:L1 cell adhesion molecule like protein